MTPSIASFELSERTRRIVDWSVFYAGALSLVVAIGGTVVTHIDASDPNQADAQDAIVVVADQTVL